MSARQDVLDVIDEWYRTHGQDPQVKKQLGPQISVSMETIVDQGYGEVNGADQSMAGNLLGELWALAANAPYSESILSSEWTC